MSQSNSETITVKSIVEKVIQESKSEDIEIDSVLDQYPDFDRVDVVNAMKALQHENLGVLVVGRRNKKTRFRKGYMRVPVGLNQSNLDQLRNCLSTLKHGTEFPLEDGHGSTQNATEFFQGNKNHALEALKQLESEGLGLFLIGRRGGYSRFVVGLSREEFSNKAKTSLVKMVPIKNDNVVELHTVEQKTSLDKTNNVKYTVVSGIMFKSEEADEEGYASVKEALDSVGCEVDDLDKLCEALEVDDFCKLEDYQRAV
jgi:hypothetical protein